MYPKIEAEVVQKKRVKLEETFIKMCGHEPVSGDYICTLMRVLEREKKPSQSAMSRLYDEGVFRDTLWRAFYNRHPEKMLDASRSQIRHIAQEFQARDQADAAMNSMNCVLKANGIKTERAGYA